MNRSQFKISRDLLYGDIKIPTNFLECIVDTRQFQLLDWRRQLGTAHLIYRNAHHTRFEHSLGVFELSRQLASCVEERDAYFPIENNSDGSARVYGELNGRYRLTSDHLNLLHVASLIHDIGNYPFCHQLERSLTLELPNHEHIGSLIIRQKFGQIQFLDDPELGELGLLDKRDALADVINTKVKSDLLSTEEKFVQNVISGPYGLDFLDYIYRDTFYCGFSIRPTTDFLLDHAVVLIDVNSNSLKFGFTHHVLHELISLAYLRLDMERKVYSNKTHKAVSEMLSHAIGLAVEDARLNLNEMCMFTDDGLLAQLERLQPSRKIIKLIRSRRLHEVVYRFDAIRPDVNPTVRHALDIIGVQHIQRLRKRIFDELADHSIDEDDILLSFPHPEERTCKEGEISILMESGEVRALNTLNPWITRYEEEYRSLRKYLVLMSHDAVSLNGDKAREILQKNFEPWVLEIYGFEDLTPQSVRAKLRTLSDTQIQILNLLSDRSLTTSEIGSELGKKSRGTVLYHLKKLLKEGFLRKERRGKKVEFTLTPECISFLPEMDKE